ncbi:hypothetical protein [Ralstonia sp. 24A2]|uniref:hypothetical protein n=1 Tax=Ralstonia sp. 24A2 TaxID=3447364 RepID=UPI003F69D228
MDRPIDHSVTTRNQAESVGKYTNRQVGQRCDAMGAQRGNRAGRQPQVDGVAPLGLGDGRRTKRFQRMGNRFRMARTLRRIPEQKRLQILSMALVGKLGQASADVPEHTAR